MFQSTTYDFLLTFRANHGRISYVDPSQFFLNSDELKPFSADIQINRIYAENRKFG